VREIPKPTLAVYAAAVVAVALIGARWLHSPAAAGAAGQQVSGARSSARSATAPAAAARPDAAGPILVDIAGAVRHPGVYRLAGSARVYEAIRRAGGLRGDADRLAVNLAARVADGQQVVVPARGHAATGTAAVGGAAAGTTGPISINSASAAQLEALDGVGPATAQRIVTYREQHGGFRSLQELDQVGGIGPKRLAALLPQLTL
jgi:competence protein ComEA